MITPALVRTLSDYNQWQNASIYAAADTLSPEERAKNRGAFWGSVEGTLNHILWGDRLWLSRLGCGDGPNAKSMPETAREGGDWVRFYAAVEKLGELPVEQRKAALRQLERVGR